MGTLKPTGWLSTGAEYTVSDEAILQGGSGDPQKPGHLHNQLPSGEDEWLEAKACFQLANQKLKTVRR